MNRGMTIIVKTVARLLSGLIFLFGFYIICHGHLTPGGGFAGGVVVSGGFILLFLAYGSEEATNEIKIWRAAICESLGTFFFWLTAMIGLLGGSFFFLNILPKGKPFHLLSAGIIPLCNLFIGIEVAASVFGIFIALSILKRGDKS